MQERCLENKQAWFLTSSTVYLHLFPLCAIGVFEAEDEVKAF